MKSMLSALALAGLIALGRADGCPAIPPPPVLTVIETATAEPTPEATTPPTVVAEPTPSVVSIEISSVASVTDTTSVPTQAAVFSTSPVQTTMLTVVLSSSSTSTPTISTSTASTSAASTSTSTSSTPTSSSTSISTSSTSTSAAAVTSTPSTSVKSTSATISGKSTFYGGNVAGGACSFSTYTLPSSLFGVAYSGEVWNSAAQCGRCVEVTGPSGNSITAMIVDECPECDEGHLDLFQDAFEELGAVSAGILSTSYSFVDCGISSPLVLHSKSGTSAYWFSMQVVNSNEGVTALEVSTDGGSTWKSTTRTDYNFFENSSGFGSSTVDVRVTSTSGTTIVVEGVSCASDAQTTASSNF